MSRPQPLVLVVDRESEATRALVAALREQAFEVAWSRDGESALNALEREIPDCLVTELEVQRIDGMAVLRRARERNREVCAVVIADRAPVERVVEAMREGAHDVQQKPVNVGKLLAVLRRGLSHQALLSRVAEVEERLDERFGIDQLAGRSRAMGRVMEQVRHIASTRATVLIEGEPGTGKGMVAQAIHQSSPRKGGHFVRVSAASFGEGVIESELFGVQGTDGVASRGRIDLADGGTLFLDEVSELPPRVQVKLLRLLQDRAFERVGGTAAVRADVRLVVATHRDLALEVRQGRFREDLFQRLTVARMSLPPLRERREDIPLLLERFLREFNREHGRKVTGVTRGVLERLVLHAWPGNVRELRNTVEGMVVFAEGRRPLDLSDLPAHLREVAPKGEGVEMSVGMTMDEAERLLVTATLRHTGGDKVRAAAMLGIGLRTLYRKVKQYGIR